ncbi:MAG: hypothetical protein Hals2KO_35650 [Halioglobus sp.]
MRSSSNLLLRQLSRRTPLYHRDFPFVLLWAQKAGCTYLLKWFLWQLGLLDSALAYGQQGEGLAVHDYENQVFKARRFYVRGLARRIRRSTPIVNFVRCPYARVFSSYMHVNNRHFARLIDSGQFNPALRFRTRIVSALFGEHAPPDAPISFADYLSWLSTQDMATVDAHHRPQTTPLYALPTVRHFRLDQVDVALDELEASFGLRCSKTQRECFRESDHHTHKVSVDSDEALRYLQHGVPLKRARDTALPHINRDMLQSSPYNEAIERLFGEDIRLYDSLA